MGSPGGDVKTPRVRLHVPASRAAPNVGSEETGRHPAPRSTVLSAAPPERSPMRISELSARTDVPVGTIKFYLREGLLPPGRRTSRTAAEYNDAHVERIRLIRALTDAGGLGIAAVRRIVTVLDSPQPARLDLLATAQDALLAEEPAAAGEAPRRSRARDWAAARGWTTFPEDLLLERLDRVWQACEEAGIDVDDDLLDRYAEAMEQVARLDVDTVPTGPEGAVHRVIVGTVMLEPVLLALRLLARRELSLRETGGSAAPCSGASPSSGADAPR